ncbi:MAG: FKBP-type peptidyl-prolyl cis-trans isomerase, partial [Nanoarchaeota archaeon]
MQVNKKDFIEIEFTGRTKEGEIFDSNIEKDLKKAELNIPVRPLVICVGERMFLESVDDFLIGKEIGKEYEITLTPEKAFGIRDSKLVKMIPIKAFLDQ